MTSSLPVPAAPHTEASDAAAATGKGSVLYVGSTRIIGSCRVAGGSCTPRLSRNRT